MSENLNISVYEEIGGEVVLHKIVDQFYQLMDELPEAKGIRLQHKPDLSEANEKLFMFLSGWLGGPQLFVEKYGHPRLRARHLPFAIGTSERGQWMFCMVKSLEIHVQNKQVLHSLISSLYRLADHMRNQQTIN